MTPTTAEPVGKGRFVRMGAAVAAAVVALDQLTKWLILDAFSADPRAIEVLPVFNLVLVWNWGVSFGMFSGQSPVRSWALVALALGISAYFARWLVKADNPLMAAGVALIIGGALGNVIDRVRFGAVVDFLDVHVLGYHWPAFNVADAAITVGAAAVIFEALFGEYPSGDAKRGETS